jgi:hypothetical protein
MIRLLAPVVAALLALCAMPAAAINKCVGKDGKITYQDDKCPDDAKAGAMKEPSVASGMLPPEEDPENASLNTLVWAISAMELCSQASPAYAQNAAKAMAEYRRENAQWFARLERSKRYQEILREARARNAQKLKDPAQRREAAETCGDGK